ncbi:MAG: hypothetical protein O3B01_05215 [Planctomycetota bacterium]|nr:hypothetical protein [Planctomycetota bacterium]MDA1137960.1 hypothetical protein [Planctomycetota bacterium]
MAAYTSHLISEAGSTRATAYQMGNKIVTLEGRTHVVWVDAIAEIRGKTFDHSAACWSDTFNLGTGCDNHSHPVIIADAEGHIHLVYGPHGWWGEWNCGRFVHQISEQPNSLETWKSEDRNFGYNATYASMVHTPSGLDCIVYRGGQRPNSFMFQRQRELGGWTDAKPLMHQEIPQQYTHWSANIVCDSQGTLYAGGHFYNMDTDKRSPGAAAIKSTDMGDTWTALDGSKLRTPVTRNDEIAVPHEAGPDADIRLEGLAIDGNDGLWISTSGGGKGYVSRWQSGWQTFDLSPFIPANFMASGGPLTIDAGGDIHLVAMVPVGLEIGEGWFGRDSLEVLHLHSKDSGRTFECNQISQTDPSMASWIPSISRAGIYHPVESPVFLYTKGNKGDGCSPKDANEVYCVFAE